FDSHDTAPTEISTLSLHDALPILGNPLQPGPALRDELARKIEPIIVVSQSAPRAVRGNRPARSSDQCRSRWPSVVRAHEPSSLRSEEHTSELQSRENLVCRLLLEK